MTSHISPFPQSRVVLIPSDFKYEFCPCYLSCALSLVGKPSPCSSYSGCGGINVWDGSFHRHWSIWSFSATGSYDLTFLLCTNKECFVCTAESKTTCRQFLWYSGFAEAWQEEKPACVCTCYICCVAPPSLHPGLHPTTIYYCGPGRLVRFFFQSRELWKGDQIYLSALWRP